VNRDNPADQAEHTRRTREAYDRLAAVWSATTEEGPFNGRLERPALRSLVPGRLAGAAVLDAGFVVDRVAEARPSDEAVRLFPDDLADTAEIPSFIVYRLWLRP